MTALPASHPRRSFLKVNEVPEYLKRVYNLSIGEASVRRWHREGVLARHGSGKIKLKIHRIANKRFVKKSDLQDFLERCP